MLSLVRADWYRIRRRWDVWLIVLGVPALAALAYLNGALAAGGSQFQTSSVGDVPPDLQAQIAAQSAAMQYVAALPYQFPRSIVTLLSGATLWLALGSGFLAASLLGNEFAWGTIRNVVLFRPDRSRYLAVRSLWIAGLVVASLAVMIALGAFLPTLVPVAPGDPTAISKLDPNQGIPYGTVGSVDLGGALLIGAATAATAAAAVALVGLCALKFRSAASGMLGAGIYVVAEGVLAGLVEPHLTGNLRYLPQLSLMNRLEALVGDATRAAGLTNLGDQGSPPGWYVTLPPPLGVAIVAVWIAGLMALWFLVLRRADIHE
jgi:ABC-2 family transporter protein